MTAVTPPASPGERGTKRQLERCDNNSTLSFLSQYRKCGMSESSPVGAEFLLVQDTVGADPRPHGVEWQKAFFFYDLDMTRRAQCPL